jgi:Thioredoxin like C-terminal domain
VQAASDEGDLRSPETYIGYGRAENFVSPGGAVKDASHLYAMGKPQLNEWRLSGDWTIGEERAALDKKDGSIAYRFHARDLHLVLGSGSEKAAQLSFALQQTAHRPARATALILTPMAMGW